MLLGYLLRLLEERLIVEPEPSTPEAAVQAASKSAAAAAPLPVGPYSQAVVHGGLVFASGQIPLDPRTEKLVEGEIEAQTERVIENLRRGARGGGLVPRRRAAHHRLPDRPRALRAHERGVRALLRPGTRGPRARRCRWPRCRSAR